MIVFWGSRLISTHRNKGVLAHQWLWVCQLDSSWAAVWENARPLVAIYPNISYQYSPDSEYLEISCQEISGSWEKSSSGQKSKVLNTSGSERADRAHSNQETWDCHRWARPKYNRQPKYRFLWSKLPPQAAKVDDTIVSLHSLSITTM